MEVNTDQLNEIGKGYLFRACKSKGVSHCHLDLAEAGRDMGRLYSGKSRRLQMCPDWRLSAWGRCRHLEVVQPMWLVRGTQLAFSDLSYAGNGDKKERNCQL